MQRPQLYNIELTEAVRNNPQYITALISIYKVPKEKSAKIIDDINNGRKTVVACLPLDIAKTVSDIFINTCHKNNYTSKINLQLSGKYDE